MHELGVVFHIIDDLKEVAVNNEISEITKVVLELGEVSTVIDSYLTDCWKWAVKKEDLLKNSELVIEKINAVTYCEDCKAEYETVKYGKICPECGAKVEKTEYCGGFWGLVNEKPEPVLKEPKEESTERQPKEEPDSQHQKWTREKLELHTKMLQNIIRDTGKTGREKRRR